MHDTLLFRLQDPTAAAASSTSAGCTPDHLADLVGFVLRCHLEVEELMDIARRQVLNTGQVRPAKGRTIECYISCDGAKLQFSFHARLSDVIGLLFMIMFPVMLDFTCIYIIRSILFEALRIDFV